jgi:deoxyhypusine synthase
MDLKKSLFKDAPDIIPVFFSKGMAISDFVDAIGQTSFEARNVYRGARLFRRMIDEDDMIWLGIAGAGIAGGMGGMVTSLIERGFIDVICSTGAQVYHDLHFAFDLLFDQVSIHFFIISASYSFRSKFLSFHFIHYHSKRVLFIII